MAQEDNQKFLEDLLQSWDPEIDLSPGSETQTQVIDPILNRISIDPFDEDIATFITQRIQETHPDLAITDVDALQDTVINPMRVLIEPLVREVKLIKLRTDLGNASSMSSDELESLLGNFFERRNTGGYATGVIRLYFANPQGLTVSLLNAGVTKSSALRFFPTRPQSITAIQMGLNLEGDEYYFDVSYKAERQGDEYNVGPGELSDVLSLPTASRVSNLLRFRGGTPHESSSGFVSRVEQGGGEKTLNTTPGSSAVLRDAFPEMSSLLSVGSGEAEMNRDILSGGSLGDVPAADVTGNYVGFGTVDGSVSTILSDVILSTAAAGFIQKLGAQGTAPLGWWVSITYRDVSGTPDTAVTVDTEVIQVVSDDAIKVATALPVAAVDLVWTLRQRKLTISDIPGGIVFPNTIDGTLEVAPDEVHIGGHTDFYISGNADEATALIDNLSDENPVARGVDASTTAASSEVLINDLTANFEADVQPNMSLVIGEGADAGSYRIIDVLSGLLTLEFALTGTQSGLVWRIVDEIDVELTDPKEIRLTGSDMVTSSGLGTVTTTGSVNFVEANIQVGDTLELTTPGVDGDYTVDGVLPTELTVSPIPTRSFTNIPYRVFRRSGVLETPIVRVSAIDITDSSGSPVGTTVPYRDPVYVESRGFANEGDALEYEGLVLAGYVSTPFVTASGAWSITLYNAEHPTNDVSVFNVVLSASTPEDSAALMNAAALVGGTQFIVCSVITLTQDYPDFGMSNGDKLLTAYSDFGPIASASVPFPAFAIPDGSDIVFATKYEKSVQAGDAVALGGYLDAPPIRVGNTRFEDTVNRSVYTSQGPQGRGAHADFWNLNPLRPGFYTAKIGKPSVGVVRAFFLEPTSVTAGPDTRATVTTSSGEELLFRPDPDNRRQILPALPGVILPATADVALQTNGDAVVTDAAIGIPTAGLEPGDIIRLVGYPIISVAPLPASIPVGGEDFYIALGAESQVHISFALNQTIGEVIDTINDAMGVEVASEAPGGDLLQLSNPEGVLTTFAGTATDARPTLQLTVESTDAAVIDGVIRELIVDDVTSSTTVACTLANPPAVAPPVATGVQYIVERYTQRISSTEMAVNVSPAGMYYADFQMLSVLPGNEYNTHPGESAEMSGYASDGYRLSVENSVLSYSRGEVLFAEFSRSIILPGSSDAPTSAVQLSSTSIRVNYDRSQLVDDVQSYVLADRHRVLAANPLVRHLLPHYVSLDWTYIGGPSVPVMEANLRAEIEGIERDGDLEITTLVKKVRSSGSTSVYSNDVEAESGRSAPRVLVIYHDADRRVRALPVTDVVDTGRIHKFFADSMTLRRTSTGGIS